MKHKIEVVMLPTEDKHIVGNISKCIKSGVYAENEGDLVIIGTHTTIKENTDVWQAQHLYITVDQSIEPIKEGDWFLNSRGRLFKADANYIANPAKEDMSDHRKVVAATDPKLTLPSKFKEKTGLDKFMLIPQLEQSFLKEYCENPDKEWEVEWETQVGDWRNSGLKITPPLYHRPKLNQDNEVTITSVEEKMYSREEVNSLIHDFYRDFCAETGNEFERDNWIKENL